MVSFSHKPHPDVVLFPFKTFMDHRMFITQCAQVNHIRINKNSVSNPRYIIEYNIVETEF